MQFHAGAAESFVRIECHDAHKVNANGQSRQHGTFSFGERDFRLIGFKVSFVDDLGKSPVSIASLCHSHCDAYCSLLWCLLPRMIRHGEDE
jgi:hypothetical protein